MYVACMREERDIVMPFSFEQSVLGAVCKKMSV